MILGIFLGLLFIILFSRSHSKLSTRLEKCEKHIDALKKNLANQTNSGDRVTTQQVDKTPLSKENPIQGDILKLDTEKKRLAKDSKVVSISNNTIVNPTKFPLSERDVDNKLQAKKSIRSPKTKKTLEKSGYATLFLRENWMGIFGSIIFVFGAVFFALTSSLMQNPLARIITLLLTSVGLLGIVYKLEKSMKWALTCGWLRAISGCIILFVALGIGGIEGLQLIHSPFYALLFLCLGIAINLYFAFKTSFQLVASLHVVLCVSSFIIAPQAFVMIPLGAIVASVGLLSSYKKRWNLHLLIIISAYTIQNTHWIFHAEDTISLFFQVGAMVSSFMVASVAGWIHYSYRYQKGEVLGASIVSHICNWIFLVWNIYLYAQVCVYTPGLLAFISLIGFLSARYARSKKVEWLYVTDTIISQMILLAAIASLYVFPLDMLDLSSLALLETILFTYIHQKRGKGSIVRVGYFLQFLAFVVLAKVVAMNFHAYSSLYEFPISIIAASFLCMGQYALVLKKGYLVDTLDFLFNTKTDSKYKVSILQVFGSILLVLAYQMGLKFYSIQIIVLLSMFVLALWRKKSEDRSLNTSFATVLVGAHVIAWMNNSSVFEVGKAHSILLARLSLLGIVLLDAVLVFGDFLTIKLSKVKFHSIVICVLGLTLTLFSYVFIKNINTLFPGLFFLGISLLALELGRSKLRYLSMASDIKHKIQIGMIYLGFGFLMLFILEFSVVHLQMNPIWGTFSLRWITEIMGVAVLVYWITFFPRNTLSSNSNLRESLFDITLAFLTVSILVESSEFVRPIFWVITASGILLCKERFSLPNRFFLYAWIYFLASIVHVAFISETLTMPAINTFEKYNLSICAAILAQILFVCVAHRSQKTIAQASKLPDNQISTMIAFVFKDVCVTMILPILVGLGILFTWNFEKTILTLLWFGLTSLYICFGLMLKSKKAIQISMALLVVCSIRLLVFDLIQKNLSIRALIFIGVGILMLCMSILYKKLKHRLEMHENI